MSRKEDSVSRKEVDQISDRSGENEQVSQLRDVIVQKDCQIEALNQKFMHYSNLVQMYLSKKLLELEQLKREKFKSYLIHQRQRLGEYISRR